MWYLIFQIYTHLFPPCDGKASCLLWGCKFSFLQRVEAQWILIGLYLNYSVLNFGTDEITFASSIRGPSLTLLISCLLLFSVSTTSYTPIHKLSASCAFCFNCSCSNQLCMGWEWFHSCRTWQYLTLRPNHEFLTNPEFLCWPWGVSGLV